MIYLLALLDVVVFLARFPVQLWRNIPYLYGEALAERQHRQCR
jgi:hypothetical protein